MCVGAIPASTYFIIITCGARMDVSTHANAESGFACSPHTNTQGAYACQVVPEVCVPCAGRVWSATNTHTHTDKTMHVPRRVHDGESYVRAMLHNLKNANYAANLTQIVLGTCVYVEFVRVKVCACLLGVIVAMRVREYESLFVCVGSEAN